MPIVRVPALGLTKYTTVMLAAGLFALGMGAGFGVVLSNVENEVPSHPPLWFFHATWGSFLLLGIAIVVWSLIEMARKFEFTADLDGLYRASVFGPIRRTRFWRRGDIAGTAIRFSTCGGNGWWEDLAELKLVLADGRSVKALPPRETSMLAPINSALRRILRPALPTYSLDDPPEGGGLRVLETPQSLQIIAEPISPSLVPGRFYALGAVLEINLPIFFALIAVYILNGFAPKREIAIAFCILGTFVTIAGMVGGGYMRRWIRKLAETRFEIQIDAAKIVVLKTRAKKTERFSCARNQILEVTPSTVVSEGEGRQTRPVIVRLEIISKSQKPIELLYGRPPEETAWVLKAIRRRLNLPASE